MRLNIIVNGDDGRAEINALAKSTEDLQKDIKKINALMEYTEKIGQKDSKTYKTLTANHKKYSDQLHEEQNRLDYLNRQLDVNKMTMKELAEHIKLTKQALSNAIPGTDNFKRLNNELRLSKQRMKELGDSSKATGGILRGLSKINLGVIAAIRAASGAIRGVSRTIGTIADFEQANANLATIIGKNVDAIGDLTRSARELGGTTEYTASQVTSLQTELAKLGFKEKDIMNMQESVLHFSTAVGADLSEAASLAGATLRMFDLSTSQTEDTLGVLTKATTNSALSFSYLQTSLSIVGPVAKTFGFSVRDTTALLGTLANSGFDASSAATATRNILLKLADANGDLAVALGGPVKTLPELVEGLKKLDAKGVDLATTLELTDRRSVSAFNAFLRGAGDMDTLRESLEDVKGVLGDTAEARMNTVNGSIKLLKSAWEEFILSLSKSKGVIKSTIDLLTDLVHKITPKQKDKLKLGDAQAQGEGLMASYWNSAVTDEAREEILTDINHQIDEARKVLEGMEKGFSKTVGRRQRKQAEKNLAEARHNVEMLEAAREDYFNRVKWESGTYYEDSGTTTYNGSGGSGGGQPSGGSGATNGKKASFDPVKDAEQLLAAINKEWEDHYKEQEELEKEEFEVCKAVAENKTSFLIREENDRYKLQLARFKEAGMDTEAVERLHQINLSKIEYDAFNKRQNEEEADYNLRKTRLQNQHREEILVAKTNHLNVAAARRRQANELLDLELEFLEKRKKALKALYDMAASGEIKLSTEELNKLNQQIASIEAALGELNETGGGENGGKWGIWLKDIQKYAQSAVQLMSTAITTINAKENAALKNYQKIQEKEKKALQNRLDSGLMSQKQYEAEVEKMQAEAEAKEEDIRLRQARREKSMNLIQSIMNTATAVVMTYKNAGGWPAGVLPAAIMGAIGAAQTALIAAQPVTGAEEGGFINTRREQDGKHFKARLSPDKRGFISSPTVLVGENGGEYVIPAAGLDNPTLRPMLATIETARQAGRLKDLNFEAIYPLSSPIGRESGGYVQSPPPTSTPNVATAANGTLETLAEAISVLNDRLSKPIKADVSMTGRNGIIEKTEEYNRAKKRGQYNG